MVFACADNAYYEAHKEWVSPDLSFSRNREEILATISSSDEDQDFEQFPPWSSRNPRCLSFLNLKYYLTPMLIYGGVFV